MADCALVDIAVRLIVNMVNNTSMAIVARCEITLRETGWQIGFIGRSLVVVVEVGTIVFVLRKRVEQGLIVVEFFERIRQVC